MKNFELHKKCEETGLWWIRATRDIPFHGVKKGDLGGRVASLENLDEIAWVSGNAQVSGNARVSGNAMVSGNARVNGNAWVSGDAWVNGNARVSGNAQVSENAMVSGNARVNGDAQVSGNARVSGDAMVYQALGCIHTLYLNYGVTITSHVQVGCQQYTYEEFYGLQVDDYLAEGLTEQDYQDAQEIIIPMMIKMERDNNVK